MAIQLSLLLSSAPGGYDSDGIASLCYNGRPKLFVYFPNNNSSVFDRVWAFNLNTIDVLPKQCRSVKIDAMFSRIRQILLVVPLKWHIK